MRGGCIDGGGHTAIADPYSSTFLHRLQIDNGVEGLIIGGTTGEGQLMSWDEHVMLIAHSVNR